ncbi:MAG: putative Ig domain-containing protein [Rhodocyclaceae bacterium]|nr:putative Ig domain-containing protein [Rhodocyclaceae bacterium]
MQLRPELTLSGRTFARLANRMALCLGAVAAFPVAATITITGVTCTSVSSSVDASGNVIVACTGAADSSPPASNGGPTIGNVPSQTVVKGAAYSLGLSSYVTNSSGTLTYQMTGTLPLGLSLNSGTGLISGTPAANAVGSTVSWTASDANGPGSPADSIAFTVQEAGSSTCGGSGGIDWTNFNRPGLTTSGTLLGGANQTTVSYSFVMGKTDFPGGAQILLNVSGSYSNVRDHFISSCPGDFTNPPAGATLANCRRLNAKTGTMYLGYTDDPATQNSLTCNLVPGQTYYLNMRTVYSSSQGNYLSSGYLLNTNWR